MNRITLIVSFVTFLAIRAPATEMNTKKATSEDCTTVSLPPSITDPAIAKNHCYGIAEVASWAGTSQKHYESSIIKNEKYAIELCKVCRK